MIQRQIKQLARALGRPLGLNAAERNVGAALDELDRAYEDILGTPRMLLDRVDDKSVDMMLGRVEKLDAYAWLLDKEAELRETRGEQATAAQLRERASRVAVAADRMRKPDPAH